MTEEFVLRISDMSELEVQELNNELESHLQDAPEVELASEALPNESFSGDPGLVHALMTYGPQVIPPLAAALAAWIAAGRKRKTVRARKLVISRAGITYADVDLLEVERQAAGKPLEEVLEKLLDGSNPSKAKSTEA